jgi:hypothetical protein
MKCPQKQEYYQQQLQKQEHFLKGLQKKCPQKQE